MQFGTLLLALAAGASTVVATPLGRGKGGDNNSKQCTTFSSKETIMVLERHTKIDYEQETSLTFSGLKSHASGTCELIADFEAHHPRFLSGGNDKIEVYRKVGKRETVVGSFEHTEGKKTKKTIATFPCSQAEDGLHFRINTNTKDGRAAWTQLSTSGVFLRTGKC
ncbi:hypothetical protein F5Y18DRAFT_383665 [Xylariaceae sp. FL1019]|nr:hypothetical protein F5Y18DRAFT_383665 [Xylariaceae sp. FL1019]